MNEYMQIIIKYVNHTRNKKLSKVFLEKAAKIIKLRILIPTNLEVQHCLWNPAFGILNFVNLPIPWNFSQSDSLRVEKR